MIKENQPVFILHDQGYKLGPPGRLTDTIRNVRTIRKTPGLVIWEETTVLMRVIVKVSRRFNLFWILHDRGFKLGPPGGLTDPIRNVRNVSNVRKAPGWVILGETATGHQPFAGDRISRPSGIS